ncbi:hypothetical protein DPMN_071637 [Dreissena polymorpha]|uniref:lysozyme n=1 Tax=Dreissena polymorpha TaxID=45954 RepID=A0A9D4BPU4_DREPO|nr:hypothetical protein DPMN_071637 [Dreissena polymorpha]
MLVMVTVVVFILNETSADRCKDFLGGVCRDTSTPCDGGRYHAGFCDGQANRQCCVHDTTGDSECKAILGVCQDISSPCTGGIYHEGLCTGPVHRQCCSRVKVTGTDHRCKEVSGVCQSKFNPCSGGYITGLCTGPSDRQCCVPDTESELHFFPGRVSRDCLGCICKLESGCSPTVCNTNDMGLESCGYFQINPIYWIDCGKPGKDWKSCARDIQCSSQCVQNYMTRNAREQRCSGTCEGYARKHNGGPGGCKNDSTFPYWNKLKSIPGCENI